MRQLLRLHPDSRCFAAAHVEVGIVRPRADSLVLSYTVIGQMSDIRLPPVMEATRSDELWRSTCFEAFVRASPAGTYYEFNFAPSTQWAAYRFDGYRSGMCVAAEITVPSIEVQSGPDRCTLHASLELDRLSGLSRQSSWRLALSALVEDTSGCKSYWALAHPPGKPDFHHPDCFLHELPAAVRP